MRWRSDPQVADLARRVKDLQTDEATEALLRQIADSGQSGDLLKQLAQHKDPIVRSWAGWAAAILDRQGASDLLLTLARDKDPDVRDAAVEDLARIEPRALELLKPDLHARVRSREFFEPVTAMWALAALRDKTAIPTIRNELPRWDNGMQLNTARVVLLVLEGREEELVSEIRGHNHGLMPWLCGGAAIIASPECIRALEECAASAPDEECRSDAQRELDRLRTQRF